MLGLDAGVTSADSARSASEAAMIDFYGPADLTTLVDPSVIGARAAEQFLGGTPQQVPDRYQQALPVDQVKPGAPPALILQGPEDSIVPLSQVAGAGRDPDGGRGPDPARDGPRGVAPIRVRSHRSENAPGNACIFVRCLER
jgi:hypothetical protein